MKNKIKYSEQDMAALIGEIESQFSTKLAKAEKEKTDLKKSEVANVNKVEEKPVVEAAPQEQDFNYDESDIAEMNAMYGSMTKAEATAHFESLKKALSKDEQEMTPAVKVDETIISKSEIKDVKSEQKDDETKLLKSEIETLKSEKEKLEKSFQDLTAKLTQFFKGNSAPKQRSVTKLEYIGKSEDEQKINEKSQEDVSKLDKSEVAKRLTAKIRSGKLEKAEKEKINEFYQSGSKNIESIRHLLTGGN